MFCFLLKQCLIGFLNIHRIFFCTHNPLCRPDCLELRACFCLRVLGLEACVTLPACLCIPFNGCTLEERGGKEKVFPSTMNVYLLFFKNIFSVSICIYVYVGCWRGHVYASVCVCVQLHGSQLSPDFTWVLGMQCRSPGFSVSSLPTEPSHMPEVLISYLHRLCRLEGGETVEVCNHSALPVEGAGMEVLL